MRAKRRTFRKSVVKKRRDSEHEDVKGEMLSKNGLLCMVLALLDVGWLYEI